MAFERALTSIEQMPSMTAFSPGASVGALVFAGDGMSDLDCLGVLGALAEGEARRAGEDGIEGEAGGVVWGEGEVDEVWPPSVSGGGARASALDEAEVGSGGGGIEADCWAGTCGGEEGGGPDMVMRLEVRRGLGGKPTCWLG